VGERGRGEVAMKWLWRAVRSPIFSKIAVAVLTTSSRRGGGGGRLVAGRGARAVQPGASYS
jgi:hypothetical protein